MKKINLSFSGCLGILFFCACSARQESNAPVAFHWQNNQKLKQKALLLQKKLDQAQRTLSKDEQAIQRLRVQVCEAELNAIEAKVESLEKKWKSDPQRFAIAMKKEIPGLFQEERETIGRIIQEGSGSLRAHLLLNRILQLITQLSDL